MAKSHRIFIGSGHDARIEIPMDRPGGTVAERARRATLWLISRGIYPTPSAVNMRMRGRTRDNLNGIEGKERNRVMRERGFGRMRALPKWIAESREEASDGKG